MKNITDHDKEFLLKEFQPVIGYTLISSTLDKYLKAEMILEGSNHFRKLTCRCEIPELKNNTEKLFNQWKESIDGK